MINKEFKSIMDLLDKFPDEKTCTEHLEKIRWPDGPASPFIEDEINILKDELSDLDVGTIKGENKANEIFKKLDKYKVYKCKGDKYKCYHTGKYFNVKTYTFLDNTKVPLRKWFMAVYLSMSHKKGISSVQLSKDIAVTQKTAWFMLQRIRNCIHPENKEMSGVIEADETFIGGKNKNRHSDKKIKNSQGRSFIDKTPVFGMLDRIKKKIKLFVIPTTSKNHIQPIIRYYVNKGSRFYSDEWKAYKGLSNEYDHRIIDHSKYQYVDGHVHTNTIEGFWSILKRGYVGIYHKMTEKHLQLYCNEFAFRYNCKDLSISKTFNLFLSNMGFRLKYKDLIAWDS